MARQHTDHDTGSLAAPPDRRERRSGWRAIGATTSRIAAPIAARNGGGVLARLKAEWSAVVGPELAAIAWPEALGRDGGLKLRCAPNFALDLQHCAPLVIERINLFFGHPTVSRLMLVQGPLPFAPPPPATAPRRLSAAEEKALDGQLAAIEHPELRAALAALGQLVLAGSRRDE